MGGLQEFWATVDVGLWTTFFVGLLTGTFIGNIKTALDIYDRLRRPKIAIDCTLNGAGSDRPNIIRVTNMSPGPVLLCYWELVWREPIWNVWKWGNRDTLVSDNIGSPPLLLEPLEPKVYLFGGQYWFDWGSTVAAGRSLVFRHSLIGEKRLRDEKLA